jgi:biopolymer transport protein TolR
MTSSLWLRSPQVRALARRKRCAYRAHIDVGFPFIAVVVTLLFIHMVNAPAISHQSPVDVPTSAHRVSQPGALREDAMQVYVTRDGAIYFGHTFVSGPQEQSLRDRIRQAVAAGEEKRVYLKADWRAPYADVSVAIDAIRHAGIANVTILTEPSRH